MKTKREEKNFNPVIITLESLEELRAAKICLHVAVRECFNSSANDFARELLAKLPSE